MFHHIITGVDEAGNTTFDVRVAHPLCTTDPSQRLLQPGRAAPSRTREAATQPT